jgi:hypothetical protein
MLPPETYMLLALLLILEKVSSHLPSQCGILLNTKEATGEIMY